MSSAFFADCEVKHGSTSLVRGRYLLLFPDTGGVQVHGATGVQPCYNVDGTIEKIVENDTTTITCRDGEDVLLIVIYETLGSIDTDR